MSDRLNHEPVFRLDEALARVDDDRETFRMMIELFMEHGPKDLADVQSALDAGNAANVARSSHRLKGALLQFCAPAALQACKELEESAKAGNLAQGGQLYAMLEQEFQRLLAALRRARQGNGRVSKPTTSDHLLVIDPCLDTQAHIAEHVQGRGFSVIAASDPATALTTIDMAAPDIVITDLFLPDATGLTLLRELKARHELCPVIVMAKDAPGPMIVQALRIGAADYLHKPVTEEELAHALQRAREVLARRLGGHPGTLPIGISSDRRFRSGPYLGGALLAHQNDGIDTPSDPTIAPSRSATRITLQCPLNTGILRSNTRRSKRPCWKVAMSSCSLTDSLKLG